MRGGAVRIRTACAARCGARRRALDYAHARVAAENGSERGRRAAGVCRLRARLRRLRIKERIILRGVIRRRGDFARPRRVRGRYGRRFRAEPRCARERCAVGREAACGEVKDALLPCERVVHVQRRIVPVRRELVVLRDRRGYWGARRGRRRRWRREEVPRPRNWHGQEARAVQEKCREQRRNDREQRPLTRGCGLQNLRARHNGGGQQQYQCRGRAVQQKTNSTHTRCRYREMGRNSGGPADGGVTAVGVTAGLSVTSATNT